jgi:Activator of Hsp90 ATPase homolog 1-like protein.
MSKEKFHIEYIFDKVSKKSLWNHITTPPGLESWFADSVSIDRENYIFRWDKEEQTAKVVSLKPDVSVRYKWLDEEEDDPSYFEFIIHNIELTGSTALEITDFAEPHEKEDAIELWETQIEELKRTLGI